jgi:hypothetical protein
LLLKLLLRWLRLQWLWHALCGRITGKRIRRQCSCVGSG